MAGVCQVNFFLMILLDTCTLLWMVGNEDRISTRAAGLIGENADRLYYSAMSGFEIGVKYATGRLQLPLAPFDWLQRAMEHHGITEIPVTMELALKACLLPPIHRDPCDRIIIATAQVMGCSIATPDPLIRSYPGVKCEW